MKQEKEKKGLPFFGIPKLAPYLKPYKMLFFWMVVTGTVGSGMDAIIPLFQQHAIDHFIADKTMQGVGGWLALYILVMIIQTATNYISAYGACKAELYIGRDLKRETFNHLQTLSFSYFNQNSVGYTHARVMSDTDRIASTLAWGVMEAVWYIAYLLLAIVMMFVLNWKLALCVMVIVPVLVLSGAYFQKKLVFFHRRVREQNSKITGAFNEGITGAKTTKTLVIEDKVEQEFDDLTGEMKRLSVRAMHFRGVFMSTTAFAASIALAIVLWRGGVITRDGVILIGTLSVFMNYAQGMMEPIQWLVQVMSSLVNVQVNVNASQGCSKQNPTSATRRRSRKSTATRSTPKRKTGSRFTATLNFRTSPSAIPTAAKTCWNTLTSRSRRARTSPLSARRARENPRWSISSAASLSRRRAAF